MGRFQLDSRDSFVIMASDGLWDVMADQEAVNIAQACPCIYVLDAVVAPAAL
jgi:serine/threonine protein phosphatase PrpC